MSHWVQFFSLSRSQSKQKFISSRIAGSILFFTAINPLSSAQEYVGIPPDGSLAPTNLGARTSSLESNISFAIDALAVKRRGGQQKYLVVDSNINYLLFPNEILTSREVVHEFGWQPGGKATLSGGPSDKNSAEVTFSWIEEWEGARSVNGFANLAFPFTNPLYTTDYIIASHVHATGSSKLREGELNYWRHLTPRDVDYFSFSMIYGLRAFYVAEHMHLYYTTPPYTSTYFSMTKNRMLGFQIGMDLQVNPWSWMSWEIFAKGGIFGNDAWTKNWLGDRNNTGVLRTHHPSEVVGSYMLDADLLISFRFSEHGIFELGGGLMALWNVATAQLQLSDGSIPKAGSNVCTSGRVYYEKLQAGLRFHF